MLSVLASNIMRTTVDIDSPILSEVKRLQKKENKSLGELVSELLAVGLRARKGSEKDSERPVFSWSAKAMHARVDVADKDALYRLLDEDDA